MATAADPDYVVTAEMEAEEAELAKKGKADDQKKLKADASYASFEKESKGRRTKRLNALLDKSSLYADFLAKRMATQAEAMAKKDARAKKRLENQKLRAAAAEAAGPSAPVDRQTRRGAGAGAGAGGGGAKAKASSPKKKSGGSSASSKRKSPRGKSKAAADAEEEDDEDDDEAESGGGGAAETPSKKVRLEDGSAAAAATAAGGAAADDDDEDDDDTPVQPALFTGGKLRNYQLAGMEWMAALYENGLNGILADEMGLGKTAQTIALIAYLYSKKVAGPYLVVGPLSTLPNWYAEFQRFTPDIPVVLYHGTPEERAEKRRGINKKAKGALGLPVVITSYEIIIRDAKELRKVPWKYIVVDEGHRIKNMNCRLIRELKTYNTANRLLLTGTPLQNNLSELWSLLNFLLPDIFDDLDQFQRWFDFDGLADGEEGVDVRILEQQQQEQIVTKLHSVLKPFLLRRLKTDVELSIPPKKELILYAPMTKLQLDMYTQLLDRTLLDNINAREQKAQGNAVAMPADYVAGPRAAKTKAIASGGLAEISDREYFKQLDDAPEDAVEEAADQTAGGGKKPARRVSMVNIKYANIMMQLRKCCNHPYLLDWPLDEESLPCNDETLITTSGKMMLLDLLLPKLKATGHKVLIFSQFTTVLDILEDVFALRDHTYCRIDGSTSFADRRDAMESFNTDKSMFAFLLSTRAGGLGINLVAGDTVIIYDSDWNPQSDLQAQDRCHRIGQKNTVMVYRLVTSNTVDQRILERAEAKRTLEKLVIHKGKFKGHGNQGSEKNLTGEEVAEILKGAGPCNSVSGKNEIISKKELKEVLDRTITHKEGKYYRGVNHDTGTTLLSKLT